MVISFPSIYSPPFYAIEESRSGMSSYLSPFAVSMTTVKMTTVIDALYAGHGAAVEALVAAAGVDHGLHFGVDAPGENHRVVEVGRASAGGGGRLHGREDLDFDAQPASRSGRRPFSGGAAAGLWPLEHRYDRDDERSLLDRVVEGASLEGLDLLTAEEAFAFGIEEDTPLRLDRSAYGSVDVVQPGQVGGNGDAPEEAHEASEEGSHHGLFDDGEPGEARLYGYAVEEAVQGQGMVGYEDDGPPGFSRGREVLPSPNPVAIQRVDDRPAYDRDESYECVRRRDEKRRRMDEWVAPSVWHSI